MEPWDREGQIVTAAERGSKIRIEKYLLDFLIPCILQCPLPVVVESSLCCRGPEVDGIGGNGDVRCRTWLRKEGAAVDNE